MALNVTTAVFRPGFNIATASPSLVQWDQGQTLQFEGVELPSAYQVEFTNAVTVQAITMIGNENGVEIPNELLQQSFPITAYIVLHETAEDRETEYWATIYVKARQKPREETPDPEQSSVIDQTIAALQEGVAEAQAASQAVQNMGVEAETLPEGSEATVEKTVDPETGEVTLEFGIPEGRHGATGATPDIQIGTVTTGAPGSQAAASITGTREEPRLNLTIPQGPQGDAGVTSVNGKTGAVTLDAADVGAYAKPSGGIPKTDLDQSVQTSLGLANTALQSAPVTSVNNKTGAVVLSASDVGAKPASYEAPVSSVNEKTGAVVLDAGDIGYESTTVEDELGTINSALSSLQSVTEIIDTASGAIASFPDGSGLPMRSLVAQINPVQDLHGYDNPWPAGGGVNLIDSAKFSDPRTTYGLTTSFDGDWIVLSGTYTREEATANFRICQLSGETLPTNLKAFPDSASSSHFSPNSLGKADSGITLTIYLIEMVQNETYNLRFRVVGYEGSTAPTAWSPYSNICPISGWTGAQGAVTGFNVWDEEAELGYINTNTGVYENSENHLRSKNKFPIKENTYYYFSCNRSGTLGNFGMCFYDDSDQYVGKVIKAANSDFQTPTGATKAAFFVPLSWYVDTTYKNDISINLPNTDHSYHSYTGEPISVSWQDEAGTVYGGTATYNGDGTWTVVADHFLYVYDGTEEFNKSGTALNGFYNNLINPSVIPQKFPVMLNYGYVAAITSEISSMFTLTRDVNNYKTTYGVCYLDSGMNFDCDPAIFGSTVQSFKAKLAEFYSAGTPVSVFAKIATPLTYTITTGELIETLYGQNNVWVDTGDVSVTYQASIKGYIDKVLAS